jgi:hypothetical protein
LIAPTTPNRFPVGAIVRIRNSGFDKGTIVEQRGALGPKGANVYRVRVQERPAVYTEVLEEQLEATR